jgi:AcrR family transcriptional regulator
MASPGSELDGRAQRSARSRRALVEALFALVGEGVLRPTAQQVADRAGLGIRSVFRHFEDMDALYAEMGARLRAELVPLVAEEPPAGDPAERVRALVRRRAALFERIAPWKRAADLERWRSPFLRERHRELVRELREDLQRWLPELEAAAPELAEALDLATSFEAWNRLRGDQRLGPGRARDAMERAALALARALPGARREAAR